MSETIQSKRVFSLHEVAQSIQKTLSERYSSSFWVKAEMNKLNHYHYSGHCYPELVEKSAGKIIAQMRANLWRDDYNRLNSNFLNILKEPLKDGIKILFLAKISFDASHGLALRILDIDPAYTLGDLEAEKLQTIRRLQVGGLFDRNKRLLLPQLPQRIAIISVESSKGYADFLSVLDGNPWGYAFFKMLFPAVLQGERAVEDITNQLTRIQKVKKHFDTVVIVRGGGSDIGLASFNHITLAQAVTECSLPVMTGIGHSTNETVCEMVAYHNAITPTKLAEFLIQQFHNSAFPLQKNTEKIQQLSQNILKTSRLQLYTTAKQLPNTATNKLNHSLHRVQQLSKRLHLANSLTVVSEKYRLNTALQKICVLGSGSCQIARRNLQQLQTTLGKSSQTKIESHTKELQALKKHFMNQTERSFQHKKSERNTLTLRMSAAISDYLKNAKQSMAQLERVVTWSDPQRLLQQGFSLTLKNGRVVGSATQVQPGDVIQTVFADGSTVSQVKSTQITENE